jgi:hypothetical protein
VDEPETTIKVYSRRDDAGKIASWFATIKIPGTNTWADIRRDLPIDRFGSIYLKKEAAIVAAKREIVWRGGRKQP